MQLVRPEFQPFMENERSTLEFVRSVADVLESIAANPTHTPALYSTFLRALISAKTENPSSSNSVDRSISDTPNSHHLSMRGHGEMQPPVIYHSRGGGGVNVNDPATMLNGFQFDSEMGPVADMSTFPPTMMSNPTDDETAYIPMDSILSNNFWDNVLVPGKQSLSPFFTQPFHSIGHRLFE